MESIYKNLKAAFIIYFTLINVLLASDNGRCTIVLSDILFKRFKVEKNNIFNFDLFNKSKEKFKSLDNFENVKLKSQEEFIALFTVSVDRLNRDSGKNSDVLVSKLLYKDKSNLKEINKIFKKKFTDKSKFRNLVSKLYLIYLARDDKFLVSLKNGWINKFSLESYIRNVIGEIFLRNNLEDAVVSSGLIRNPSTLERFRLWKSKNSTSISIIANLAINSTFMYYTRFYFPISMPKISILKNKLLNKEMIRLINDHGFNAAYPELKKHFAKTAIFDIFFQRLSDFYVQAIWLYLAYFLYDNYEVVRLMWGIMTLNSQDLVNEEPKENIDKTEINENLKSFYCGWLDGYKIFHQVEYKDENGNIVYKSEEPSNEKKMEQFNFYKEVLKDDYTKNLSEDLDIILSEISLNSYKCK